MEKDIKNAVIQVVEAVLSTEAVQAIKYLSPKVRVSAVRRVYSGRVDKGHTEVLIVIGRPNVKQQSFIKDCVKAIEPFPIKNMQVKYQPKKKK